MANEIQGIDYETALANLRASSSELRGDLPEKNELLSQFHPDYQANARVKLPIGPNTGDYCHPDLAKLLISHPLIDDYDLSGAEHLNTDVLVIGGVGHVHDLQREMTRAGLTSNIKAPVLYPDYGKFDLREHAGLQEQQS